MEIKRKSLCTTVITFIFAVLTFSACTGSVVSQGPPLADPVATQIGSTRVTFGDVKAKELRQGIVRLHSEAVRLEGESGRFGAFYVWPGDEVVAGQLLARMDLEAIQLQIDNQEERISRMRRLHQFENRERALEIDVLELAYANAVWAAAETLDAVAADNIARLYENIAWARHIQQQTLARQAFDLGELEVRLVQLRAALAGTEIFAPFAGVVTHLEVFPGTWVNTSDPILYITCHDAALFVEYVGQSTNTQTMRFAARVQGQVGEDVFDLELIPLTAVQQLYYRRRELAPPIRFEIANATPPAVGTPVFIHLYSRLYENVLRVPRNALFVDGTYGSYVYRIEDGQQIRVFVTAGFVLETYVAIFDGLQEGDEVFVRS